MDNVYINYQYYYKSLEYSDLDQLSIDRCSLFMEISFLSFSLFTHTRKYLAWQKMVADERRRENLKKFMVYFLGMKLRASLNFQERFLPNFADDSRI